MMMMMMMISGCIQAVPDVPGMPSVKDNKAVDDVASKLQLKTANVPTLDDLLDYRADVIESAFNDSKYVPAASA